eukprot:TRINITY_DN4060_c0_g1_i4.p1 TRINITY_DN4060_c0_g1~~TRINITY_DN4060_c0_g1_i4.p1  ORF type:complete len:258 (+),score=59.22 TRINITY_DN4060_c0_g1_i4:213-986(+)
MAGNPSVDAVLSSLPADAEQQLEVGLHVLRHAFRKKVKELETDNANMRQFGKEKQNQVIMLEQKVASLESVVDDMTRRAKELAAENARIAAERDALGENVKKLTRDMKKLDHFKRSILNTIESDEGQPGFDPMAASSFSPPRDSAMAPDDLVRQIDNSINSGGAGQSYPMPPPGLPDIGGAASNGDAVAQLDGKEFFKRARHRLSFQQFNEFLANIKKLNSHLQNREETLQKASDIFGPENQDLHEAFQALLSRHNV